MLYTKNSRRKKWGDVNDENLKKLSPSLAREYGRKGGKAKKELDPLTDDQVERLLAATKGLPPYVFVMLGVFCGLRREEILGLQWDCVHLDGDAPYLSVERAWHTEHNRPVILTDLQPLSDIFDIIPSPMQSAILSMFFITCIFCFFYFIVK